MTLQASLTVNLSAFNNGGGSLSLSAINVTVGPDGVPAKLVDSVPDGTLQLFATYGTVAVLDEYEETVRERLEPMNGVDYIDLPHQEGLSFVLCFDVNGAATTPLVTMINGGKRAKLNKKVWGIVKHGSFTQAWKLLKYIPQLVESSGGILQITYGSIAAYKNGVVATMDMAPLPLLDTQDIEVYRVTSRSVVNEDGEFEYPPGWPDSGDYPDSAEPKPEPGTGVVPLRVHEICTMNQNGYTSVRSYPVRNAQPYIGNGSYNPLLGITEGNNDQIPAGYQTRAHDLYLSRKSELGL